MRPASASVCRSSDEGGGVSKCVEEDEELVSSAMQTDMAEIAISDLENLKKVSATPPCRNPLTN